MPIKSGGFSRKSKASQEIPSSSLADIAFLLLIFFMVTTVFRRPLAMEVNLPEPGAKVEVPESNVMTIYVDRDEARYNKIGAGGRAPVTWEELPALTDMDTAFAVDPDIHRVLQPTPDIKQLAVGGEALNTAVLAVGDDRVGVPATPEPVGTIGQTVFMHGTAAQYHRGDHQTGCRRHRQPVLHHRHGRFVARPGN